MEDSKVESSLYIETFKNEITRLCDPYTHPTYLSLLGDFGKRLLEELREALNKAIDDGLPQKGQSSPNDKGNVSEQIINLKIDLKVKIASILGEKQKGSSKDAIPSKQPSPKELITLENDLLFLLKSLLDTCSSIKSFSELIKEGTIEDLRGKLKDCFNEYRNRKNGVIRSIINREIQSHQFSPSPKETKFTLEKRCAQLDKIIEDLWVPFSKSLLEGEFLKDPEYSKKLQDIVEKIRNTYDSTLSEDIIYLHPILPCIHELCQELSYVCQCVRIQIEEPKEKDIHNKHRVFHAPVSYLGRKPYAGGVNSGEILKANLFHDLGTKLIEMTRIDLSGVIDDQAVSHLFLLYKQCNLLLKNEESNLLDFPSNTEIEGIFKSIRAKTSLLLFQSFYKPDVSSDPHKIDIEKSIETPYRRAKNFEILYEGERYHLTDTGLSGIKLLHKQLKGFESLTYDAPPSETCTQDDIVRYDNYVQRGEKGRKNPLKDERVRTEYLKDLLKNENKGQQRERILHLPLNVLLSLMKELREKKKRNHEQQIGEPTYDNSRYAQAMGFLLKCFYERLLIYKDFVAAEQKKDTYANSFYKLKEIDQKIFISSFGCKLLHTQALQDEAYHKYNQTYREWLSEAQKEAMDKAIELKKEVLEAAQKAAQEAAQEAEKAAGIATTDTRKEAISILSIFVALITFISGGISILQGTNSLADYLILTGTLYIFIVAIIKFLYFKAIEGTPTESLSSNNTDQNRKRDKSKKVLGFSTGFAIAAIIAGAFLKCTKEETRKDDGSPRINNRVENIKQIFLSGEQMISHPSLSDSVGFNAPTNEKQGGSTDKKQKK